MNTELRNRWVLIAGLYVMEAAAIAVILSLYHMTDKSGLLSFLSHKDGKFFLAASLAFVCAGVIVYLKYRALREAGALPIGFVMKMNIMPVTLLVAILEGAIALLSTDTPAGTMLGTQLLLPLFWKQAAAGQSLHERLQYDPYLGWTVKPNLKSKDGMYFTDSQGIRIPEAGPALAGSDAACKVALIGDSHTFGTELKFEDAWPSRLERGLPPECRVLNFGVPGYSLGQMYLKYLRDVRPWHPDVVVLALSSDAAGRTMGVYGVNMFPDSLPWAQPRFQIRNQKLEAINIPLPTLDEITAAKSITDLPFIEYDWYFDPGRWDLPRWRYLYNSYLFRLYATWYPAWRKEKKGDSFESINEALLKSFIRSAQAEGTAPLIVYLPDKTDYENPVRREAKSLNFLRSSGIKFLDLLPCLDAVAPEARFIPRGNHYSPAGSAAIAHCLDPTVLEKISESPKKMGILHKAENG